MQAVDVDDGEGGVAGEGAPHVPLPFDTVDGDAAVLAGTDGGVQSASSSPAHVPTSQCSARSVNHRRVPRR